VSGISVFFANDGADGVQLWRTDGSAGGTFALTTFPSTNASPSPITLVDGVAYFLEADGASGAFGPQYELWRSDGTTAGTYALGVSGDNPTNAPKVAQIGNVVYYVGQDASHGESLYASTAGQPGQFVAQLLGSPEDIQPIQTLTAVGSDLLIEAGAQVVLSDGTTAGTQPFSDQGLQVTANTAPLSVEGQTYLLGSRNGDQILYRDDGTTLTDAGLPNPDAAGDVVAVNSHFIFIVQGFDQTTVESWDGSSANVVQLAATGSPGPYYAIQNGELYFGVSDPSDPRAPVSAVYVTDGTAAGTREVAAGDFQTVVPIGSHLLLAAAGSGPLGGTTVSVSDGTVDGATLVLTAGADVSDFVRLGGQVYFNVDGNQLWISDGTVAGTHVVKAFNSLSGLTADGSQLLFSAAALGSDTQPWISDGTTAGTHQVANVSPSGPGVLNLLSETSLGSDLVFVGQAGNVTYMWASDGTVAGTAPISVVGTEAFGPLVASGGKAYASASFAGGPLWVFSGSGVAGPIGTDLDFQVLPTFLTAFNGDLVFYGTDPGQQATERFGSGGLFITDGTDAGTSLLTSDTVLTQPAVLGSQLLFLGSSSASGAGLYETDGTAADTRFIASVPTTFASGTFTISGSKAFFLAGDNTTGAELWVTDGTSGGTHLVENIAPGFTSSNPAALTPFDGGVVFTADDGQHGQQVWFSDGTAGGTFQLDINQTSDPSAAFNVGSAFVLGGKTYVIGYSYSAGPLGPENEQGVLLSTDGTAAGTAVVAMLNDPQPGVNSAPVQQLNSTQAIFDIADQQLWITDGANAGTFEVTGNFVIPEIGPVITMGGLAFFEGGEHGEPFADLFVTDGSRNPATDVAADVSNLFSGDGLIFYTAPASGQNQSALYAYQPTSQQITPLATFATGAIPAFVVKSAGQAVLGSQEGDQQAQLWVTDGSAAGTVMLAQAPGNSDFSDFTELGGKVYFGSFFSNSVANDGLWVTDGTAAGTHEIRNIDVIYQSLIAVGGDLLFLATDSSNRTAGWSYNPSTGIATESAPTAVTSLPSDFTVAGNAAYFVASDASSQGELWHVTGADVITELTSATNGEIGNGQANPISLAALGNGLFFSADDTVHGPSLFFTNGSTVTFLAQVQFAQNFTVVGNLLYFQGYDATNDDELWVSDGTPGGTHRVTDTEAPNSANASGFAAVGAKMFFAADDGVHGSELWVFNGQPGGATMVADVDPGAAGADPTDLTAFAGALFFAANNGAGPTELWRSDGTAGGTMAITSDSNGASPQDLTADGAQLFFFGSDTTHGAGLFVSDGSPGGPTFVQAFTSIADMTVEGGHLYFEGTTTAAGTELWTSDGTAAGTERLTSTGPNSGSNPTDFTALNGSPAHGDFNGDGFSDILFGQADGTLATWQMQGTVIAGGGDIGAPGGTWTVVGTGAFGGGADAAILFQDAAHNLATWQMNGAAIVGGGNIGNPGGTWLAVGVGDFNGDGMSDILFQDAAHNIATWQMDGTSIIGGGAIGNPGGTWTETGVGDFNGDGKSDILFQDAGGNLAIWEMNGTAITGGGDIGNPGSGWSVDGVGDFNADAMSDILFHNTTTGDYAIWEMNGTTIVGGGDIGNPGSNWSFAGIGDYNGDGHSDILFTDTAGDLAIWEMNGTAIVGGGDIGNPGSVWHVLG
jgi:ELWxxDGT repeat protein